MRFKKFGVLEAMPKTLIRFVTRNFSPSCGKCRQIERRKIWFLIPTSANSKPNAPRSRRARCSTPKSPIRRNENKARSPAKQFPEQFEKRRATVLCVSRARFRLIFRFIEKSSSETYSKREVPSLKFVETPQSRRVRRRPLCRFRLSK